jgi:AcrR family transcriptional regulator
MAARNGRGRPRSASAHRAILEAAIALVREVGYEALTMEAVAARAGVGKATLYRRWEGKELLVAEAIHGIVKEVPVPDLGSVERDVLALMGAVMRMYRDPATGELLSGIVAAMGRSARVAEVVRRGMVARWRHAMREVLRRAADRGELSADADLEVALDLLSGALFYRYLMLGKPVTEARTRAVVATVLRGLGLAAPGGGGC